MCQTHLLFLLLFIPILGNILYKNIFFTFLTNIHASYERRDN